MIDGDAVVYELVLPAPAEQVFGMFTDPRQLVRWIGISADLQPRPGGRFRFEVVPGQFCDGQYVPAWYQNISSVTWQTSPPLQAGSKMTFRARFLGRHLAYTYEVTDFAPAERLVMRTARGRFRWKPPTPGSRPVTARPG